MLNTCPGSIHCSPGGNMFPSWFADRLTPKTSNIRNSHPKICCLMASQTLLPLYLEFNTNEVTFPSSMLPIPLSQRPE